MDQLNFLVRQALTSEFSQLWWPGLARELTEYRLRNLGHKPEEYTTSNFLAATMPAKILNAPCACAPNQLGLLLEVMPKELNRRFADRGLTLADSNDVTAEVALTICKATSMICLIPSLAATIGFLVRSVHILRSEQQDTDISFSDPSIPFSIFMSIPTGPQADLRIAEAIIHEAMHLQLSLVEETLPLVVDNKNTYYSPWRKTHRPLAGVIHALYVFRVIDQWLSNIASPYTNPSSIAARRAQIADEMSDLNLTSNAVGLTTDGQSFVRRLLHGISPLLNTKLPPAQLLSQ